MASEEGSIPVISITTSDDINQVQINKNPYQATPEPLTDLEDLDHEPDQKISGKLKIKFDDDEGLTDNEVMEASGDEKDSEFSPKTPVRLDDIIDFGGTYEELVRLGSPLLENKRGKVERSFSTSQSKQGPGLLSAFYEREGATDYEDFDMSDEEDNVDDDGQDVCEDNDLLDRLLDDENVDIRDKVTRSPFISPSVTPDPGQIQTRKKTKTNKKGSGVRKKKSSNLNLLSPRSISPHLSDITDTEIVYSDSDEDILAKLGSISPQERRRRQRKQEELKSKLKVIQTITPQDAKIFPELEISSVHIIEKVPVHDLKSESDTDNAYTAPNKPKIYAPKKKTLLMEVAGALMMETFASTDVENFEGSNDSEDEEAIHISDRHYNVVDEEFSSVREMEMAKNRLHLPKQDRIVLTDTEDIETEEDVARGSQSLIPSVTIALRGDSTEEDDFESTDAEYVAAVKEMRQRAWRDSNYEIRFIEVDGKSRPLAVTPDLPQQGASTSLLLLPEVNLYATDTEELEEDPEIDKPKSLLNIHLPKHNGGITDTEDMEGEDDMFRPKSPEPSDDEEESQAFPEVTREMILIKEDPNGRPVSVVLPLGNVEPSGLNAPTVELEGGISEIEDILTEDEDFVVPLYERATTPEIPEMEGGIVHTSEVIKVQKKKLKVSDGGMPEPLTDTEDLFLSVSGKRRRSKTKPKTDSEVKPKSICLDLTDTEDLIFSDAENRHTAFLDLPQVETEPVTDVDDVDASGEEEIVDVQRCTAISQEYLRELEGDSYTTSKEGNGPFSEEARLHLLSLNDVPTIKTISPTPDIIVSTDTEDMMTSADEDGVSRAERMTPYDAGVELEDHSSFVYMKHTRKFDLDAPEEAMYIKGAPDIHETHTDIEDLGGVSEDERPRLPEQLFVNDTVNQVCVCLNTEVENEDSVCVCVSKEHGGLSLVWNSKNSTDAKQHRDWAERGIPDPTLDSSIKEGEEALLDLASGLQDAKGSSISGPSSTK